MTHPFIANTSPLLAVHAGGSHSRSLKDVFFCNLVLCLCFFSAASAVQAQIPTSPSSKANLQNHSQLAKGKGSTLSAASLVQQANRYRLGTGVSADEKKAADLYRRAAEMGNAEGQTRYGEALYDGRGVSHDDTAAKVLFEKAAAQQYGRAETNLGFMIVQDRGLDRDLAKAEQWLQRGAKHGDALAENELGQFREFGWNGPTNFSEAYVHYLKASSQGSAWGTLNVARVNLLGIGVEKDTAEALKWLLKVSSISAPETLQEWGRLRSEAIAIRWAVIDIGGMYFRGDGVAKDQAEAQRWFQRSVSLERSAATGGWVQAQILLANDLSSGLVPQDYPEAMRWFLKAADQGSRVAEERISRMYSGGLGVKQDFEQAILWAQKAASHGNFEAELDLGAFYASGHGVPQDFEQALKWWHQAADHGSAAAEHSIGQSYFYGKGVPQDYGQAVIWERKAADHGSADGQLSLAWLYISGKGVPQDYAEGVSWLRKAIDHGSLEAAVWLAGAYNQGKGVPQDYGQAVYWLRKAADQGHPAAQSQLGTMYERGLGVSQDSGIARYWLKKASDQGNADAQKQLAALPSGSVSVPPPLEEASRQEGDNKIPNVQYRDNVKLKSLTDGETRGLSASLHWVPNEISFGVGSWGRSDLEDGSGRVLLTVRINWDSADQRIVMTQANEGAKPKDAWKTSPKTWYGKFTAQMQNNSFCSIRPEAEITLPDKDTHVVDTVTWTNWLTLHYPQSGQQESVPHEFVIPQVSPTVVLHMRPPQPFSPLSSCMKVEQAKEQPKKAAQEPQPSAPPVSHPVASCGWSPEFDQIRHQEMLDQLRRGPLVQQIKAGGPLQQQIDGMNQMLTQFQTSLTQTEESIRQVTQPPPTDFQYLNAMDYEAQCITHRPDSAMGAANCEHVNLENSIHMAKGMLEIMHCLGAN